MAAIGLNILVGYCGQISLGTGAFMAVGAYAAYNFEVRIDGMPLIASLLLGGVCATVIGVLFGIPSLRIKGLYLAVETRVPENVTSTCNPFFVSLPMTTIDGKDWNYDVTVYPKNQTGSPDLEKTVREDKNSTGKNTGRRGSPW